MSPLLSVIVCARDDEDRIVPTLRSIVEQSSLRNVEVIVVDGASTDGTLDRARHLLGERENIVLDSRVDRGIYDAMNRGVRLAKGEFVYFLNCGDRLHDSQVLDRLVTSLAEVRDAALVLGAVRHLRGGVGAPFIDSAVPFSLLRLLLGRQVYNHQACLFRRDAVIAAGGFDSRFGVVSDYHLILRLAVLTKPRELRLLIADYEGGGVSDNNPASIPGLQGKARADIFALAGSSKRVNATYSWLQGRRREFLLRRHAANGLRPERRVQAAREAIAVGRTAP